MRTFIFKLALVVLFLSGSAFAQKALTDEQLKAKAQKLAQKFIIVDTHIDVPYRLNEHWEDISKRTEKGDFDYPRAKQGGLNAPFMSIYIPSDRENNGAKRLADSLVDMVEKFAKDWPDKFAVAKSVSDVTSQFKKGKMSLCMGMENGSPLEHKLENIQYFYNRGIRYITLTHAKDNHISDSSYDTTHIWRGLSPFGREVVAEMNRVGIMVDISHVTDQAFYEVMNVTKAPVIASHSSCRSFTPGFERNMSDDMIKLLAKNGGVIQIAFGSSFVSGDYFKRENEDRKIVMAYLKEHNLKFSDPKGREYAEQYHKDHPIPFPEVSIVAEHIDHVAKLVGVDYVGIGSDFDGVGDSLPIGLKDVSQYPNLIYELLKKGYSDNDIQKICGGNLLRVWSTVEQIAKEMQIGKS
ncbi:MAG: membrane dipeptidase [Ignavibacteriales bacterium]|nr:membrane dipeptidase [Ignavibacteriales bacterium]